MKWSPKVGDHCRVSLGGEDAGQLVGAVAEIRAKRGPRVFVDWPDVHAWRGPFYVHELAYADRQQAGLAAARQLRGLRLVST